MLNYKNQLRAMVETSRRRPTVQQEENEDDVASPEASIGLSSAEVTGDQLTTHMEQSTESSYCNVASPNPNRVSEDHDGCSSLSTTSSQYRVDGDHERSLPIPRNLMQEASFSTTNTNGDMSSFLSVSPSMVDSSMLFDSADEKDRSVSDDSAIVCGTGSEDEDLEEPRWYDRSTFESVGEQMAVDSHGDEPQVDQDVPPKTQGETTTKEATEMGAVLQAGTIVLGAASILLMLTFGGGGAGRGDRDKANKAKTSDDDDKSKRNLTRECKQSSMPTDRRMPWLLLDW
jgi:hypothetical protein